MRAKPISKSNAKIEVRSVSDGLSQENSRHEIILSPWFNSVMEFLKQEQERAVRQTPFATSNIAFLCDTRVTPEEKRRFLARRAQETKQRRALFNAETDAEET